MIRTPFAAAALALLPLLASAQDGQGFSRNGYQEHAAVSAFAGVVCATHIRPHDLLEAWGCAMVPGLLKEALDSQQRGNKFSGRDLAANALGAAVGVGAGRWLMLRAERGGVSVALVIQN